MLFADVLNSILSDNSNLVKNLIFLQIIASETEQLKNDIHSSAASYDLIRNIILKDLFIAKCNDLICDLLTTYLPFIADNIRLTNIFQDNPGKPVYRNATVLDFIGAKDDGGGEW